MYEMTGKSAKVQLYFKGYIPKQLTFKKKCFHFFPFFFNTKKKQTNKKYYNIFDQYRP